MVSPDDYRFVGASLPQLNAQEVVDALSRWDGMEDTTALFSNLLNKNGILCIPKHLFFLYTKCVVAGCLILDQCVYMGCLLHVCCSQATRDMLRVFVATVQKETYIMSNN